MALTSKLFNATTTSLTSSGNGSRVVIVGGRVKGLAGLVGATQSNALYKVIEVLAASGITTFPTGSTYPDDDSIVLTNVLVQGLSGDAVDVRLRYETPTGFPTTALIFEVDASLQAVQRDKYPGTNLPIFLGWTGRTSASGASQPISPAIPPDTGPFSYLRPIIRLSATLVKAGIMDDTAAAGFAQTIGVVNDRPWMGRAKGSWLLSNYRAQSSRFAGTLSARLEAISKRGEDWRVLDVLRSRTTGKYAIPDSTKLALAIADTYKFGKIGSGYDPLVDAFIVHGPYEMDDFASIFSPLIH